ncbi:MAG: ATP-dependent protease ATPase subunit HslU, partial [bacterium]|nr:ATP-dependent protease ATPase subunit HslU [bacterium]
MEGSDFALGVQPAPVATSAHFEDLTPRQIVARLDEYIVGQADAKRSVAVAIRNRLRRLRVDEELRDEIIPKNLILMGPTGVGKTEIARRMALLLRAPFIKVEATKFTEVGYVGRDVDSIIRDLAEVSVRLVRQERLDAVQSTLLSKVVERLLDYMQPLPKKRKSVGVAPARPSGTEVEPVTMGTAEEGRAGATPTEDDDALAQVKRIREKLRKDLRTGKLDEQPVTVDAVERSQRMMQVFTSQGMEEMGMDLQNLFDGMGDKRPKKKQTTVGEAKRLLLQEEADRAIDMEAVVRESIERVELAGIVFIDEIDKIAHRETQGSSGPDVSREGVQRDLLPLVEGTTVITKYGPVRTQHILFIAAGAFHVSKPADLIPEFQGRFPLRVELQPLSEDDFTRILREPKNSLLRQYTALLGTENVELQFTDGAVDALARHATEANRQSQNIGARRLHTVLERVFELISFEAPDRPEKKVRITADYVRER